jgi:hypothetical protein
MQVTNVCKNYLSMSRLSRFLTVGKKKRINIISKNRIAVLTCFECKNTTRGSETEISESGATEYIAVRLVYWAMASKMVAHHTKIRNQVALFLF